MKKIYSIIGLSLITISQSVAQTTNYNLVADFEGKKINIVDKKNGYYANPSSLAITPEDETNSLCRGTVFFLFDNENTSKELCTIRLYNIIFKQINADSTTFHKNISQKTYHFIDNDLMNSGLETVAYLDITNPVDGFTWSTLTVSNEKVEPGLFKITKVKRIKNAEGKTDAIVDIEFDVKVGRLISDKKGEMKLLTRKLKGKTTVIFQM